MTHDEHDGSAEHDELGAKIIAFRPARITAPDLEDAVFRASLADALTMEADSTRQELLDAVKARIRTPFTAERYNETMRDLADGERAWKSTAQRLRHQVEAALEMLRGGDVDGAERYLVEVLSEEAPHG